MKRELKVEGAALVPHVIHYLEGLVAGLRSGTVQVSCGEEQLVLGPRGVVGFSLRASERSKRQKLTLELSWRKLDPPDAAIDLTIGAAPEPEPTESPASLYSGGGKLGSEYTSGGATEEAAAEPEEGAEDAKE